MSPENERRLIAKLHWSEGLGQFYGALIPAEILHLRKKHKITFDAQIIEHVKVLKKRGSCLSTHVYIRLPKGHPLIEEIQKRDR